MKSLGNELFSRFFVLLKELVSLMGVPCML